MTRFFGAMFLNQSMGAEGDWYDDGAKKSELVYKDDQLVKKTFWDTDGYVLE